MLKVVTVLGARPQFIKAAAVSAAMRQEGQSIHEVLVHTGQHFDANMSDVFFSELGLPAPAHSLGVGGGTHGQNTGRMLEKVEAVLMQEAPHMVLVYGDTDSTLAGALAAAKLHIPVAHVEAGLRSFNRRMPEEVNRVLTDHMAALLFAPTQVAVGHLQREGIDPARVVMTGDVMLDVATMFGQQAQGRLAVLREAGVQPGRYALVTLHRAETVDNPAVLAQVLQGLERLPLDLLWPMHPRTQVRMRQAGLVPPANARVVGPLGFLDMVAALRNAAVVATDSGGVQKEAFFHQVPCVTLRQETEWTELVDLGVNHLVGTDPEALVAAVRACAGQPFSAAQQAAAPYGDGRASQRVVASLRAFGAGR